MNCCFCSLLVDPGSQIQATRACFGDSGHPCAIGEKIGLPKNALGYLAAMNYTAKIIGQACALKETGNLDKADIGITLAAKGLELLIVGKTKNTLGKGNAKFLGQMTGQSFEATSTFFRDGTTRQPIK